VPGAGGDPRAAGGERVVLRGGVAVVLVAPVGPRARDGGAVDGVAVGTGGGVRRVGRAAAAARAGAAEHRPAAVRVQLVVLVVAVAPVVAARLGQRPRARRPPVGADGVDGVGAAAAVRGVGAARG